MVMLWALLACHSFGEPGALVPATADEDPALPQVMLDVGGIPRAVHLELFGPERAPVVLMLHGSGSDYRAWLPLADLADRYRVVLWDQRGHGLSERVGPSELSFDAAIEEVHLLVQMFSPESPVALIGHDWGGMLAAHYTSRHPESVGGLALIEPGPLTGEIMGQTQSDLFQLDLTEHVLNQLQWQADGVGATNHARLDWKYLLLLQSSLMQYHCDNSAPPDWPIWRAGAFAEATRQRALMAPGDGFSYDFAVDLDRFDGAVLLLGSDCSGIGADWQRQWHLPLLPDHAAVETLEDVGHRMIAEDPDAVVRALSDWLDRTQL